MEKKKTQNGPLYGHRGPGEFCSGERFRAPCYVRPAEEEEEGRTTRGREREMDQAGQKDGGGFIRSPDLVGFGGKMNHVREFLFEGRIFFSSA